MENIKILKAGIRILRPCDIKMDLRDKFETLLYTGCRYTELQWLYKHQYAFQGSTILSCQVRSRKRVTKSGTYVLTTTASGLYHTFFGLNETCRPTPDGVRTLSDGVRKQISTRWEFAANLHEKLGNHGLQQCTPTIFSKYSFHKATLNE